MATIEKLKEIILKVMPDINVDSVNEETKLVDDLQFDSLGIMMLAMALEDEFGVHFDGPVQFVTVGDVIKYLDENAK